MFLFLSILTGLTFTLIGIFIGKFPPKNINPISGYRTKFSMKNQKTWDEAQKYSSKKTGNIWYYLNRNCIDPLFYISQKP